MTAVTSPHRSPRPTGDQSRRLQLVGPGQRRSDRQRLHTRPGSVRRTRVLFGAGVGVVVISLVGLVVSHVALAQGQFRLERLRSEAAVEQARYERLRLQVAELEAPSRVVAAAQERLGMVPPPGVTYLSPSGPSGQVPASRGRTQATAAQDWPSVKRHLAER